MSADDASIAGLGQELRQWPEIASVQVLSRDEAMSEFQSLSGFADALNLLDENPLPAVLLIHPNLTHNNPAQVGILLEKLRTLPEIDIAQLDMQWVKRLHTMMEIGKRAILVIAVLLALAVLLTVGNTIRLDIQSRRDEIIIVKLIGATNAFIRRPFLYTGLWYGFFGGIISWLMIAASLALLAGPVQRLAGLYGSDFQLATMTFTGGLALLLCSILLGLVGSWMAVGRHLHDIEPT
jgi:cell division transport system permease protein